MEQTAVIVDPLSSSAPAEEVGRLKQLSEDKARLGKHFCDVFLYGKVQLFCIHFDILEQVVFNQSEELSELRRQLSEYASRCTTVQEELAANGMNFG